MQTETSNHSQPLGRLASYLLQSRTRQPKITEANQKAVTRSIVDDLAIERKLGNEKLFGRGLV